MIARPAAARGGAAIRPIHIIAVILMLTSRPVLVVVIGVVLIGEGIGGLSG